MTIAPGRGKLEHPVAGERAADPLGAGINGEGDGDDEVQGMGPAAVLSLPFEIRLLPTTIATIEQAAAVQTARTARLPAGPRPRAYP